MNDPREKLAELRAAHVGLARLLDTVDWTEFDTCDCGHRRLEHESPRLFDGKDRCRRDGCVCFGFDDVHQRADQWRRDQMDQARRERTRAAVRELRSAPREAA